MPTPIVGEPGPITPEATGAKLPIPGLNQVGLEAAYQGMRGELKTAAAKKSLASRDEIKTSLDDGTTLKIEDSEKDDLIKTLNEDQEGIRSASDKIEQCETTWKNTGNQFKTEEEAKKSGGLVGGEKGFGGKFYRKDELNSTEKNIVTIEDDVTPAIAKGIKGLRRQISEGDTQAQKTYETLRDSNAVRVTYTSTENGAPQTTTKTLKEFDDLLEKEAATLWTNAHGGEMSFEDAKTKFPQIVHAYRIKAEQKIASDAKYTLHHSEEPKPDQSDPNKPEAEKNNEVDKAMEELYIEEFLARIGHPRGKDGKEVDVIVFKLNPDGSKFIDPDTGRPVIESFNPELLEGTTDIFLSGTTQLFATYLNLDPVTQAEQRHNLMAMIYKHVQIANPDSVKGLNGAQIFDERLNKKIGNTLLGWLEARGVHLRVNELPDATFGDMINILAFSSACQRGDLFVHAPGQPVKLKDNAVSAMRTIFGQNFNPDYENYIMALSTGDQDYGGLFLSEVFGINIDSISKQAGRVENVNKVLTNIQTSRNLSDDEMSKYREIMEHMAHDKNLDELAKKLGLPPGMGMGVLILAMFLPMIQGTLDTGGVGGGERGGQE